MKLLLSGIGLAALALGLVADLWLVFMMIHQLTSS
jgi:hypothetical protein